MSPRLLDLPDREAATMFHRMAITLAETVDRCGRPERRRAKCARDGSVAMMSAGHDSFDTAAVPKSKSR
jgi:hypothetical protein